jgi:hypothetical protein
LCLDLMGRGVATPHNMNVLRTDEMASKLLSDFVEIERARAGLRGGPFRRGPDAALATVRSPAAAARKDPDT